MNIYSERLRNQNAEPTCWNFPKGKIVFMHKQTKASKKA